MRTRHWLVELVASSTVLAGVSAVGIRADDKALFSQRVAPVLRQRCVQCHNAQKTKGGLNLTTRELLLKGGDTGPAVVPGNAAKSLLVEMIDGSEPQMPKQGKPLKPEEVADIRRWIDSGAVWPKGVTLADAKPAPRVGSDWWSLRALTRPALPAVKDRSWVRTPLDAFILATLEAKGFRPAPAADRRTLIRRVTYDLHGLPPTPAEIAAFLADPSPDAYERLLDRLLASPRYGERWGRHWLDVVHYGDTHGYDKDKRRDHAWPYRDYVIRSLNSDKPYNQFIREQVAGDVLFPGDSDGIIGTGFLAAGPWDFVGHVELRERTVEKEKTRLLDRDDMVANTLSTFLSLTVHCARCHDHKFDPIPKRDYYRLQAVFAGVDRGDRPYASRKVVDRWTAENREKWLHYQLASLVMETSPDLREVVLMEDGEVGKLTAQLARAPKPAGLAPSPTNGYHSAIAPVRDLQKWVQVDLGRCIAVDEIRLIPASPTDFPDTPGFGFPVRFRVTVSQDAAFATGQTVADQTKEDYYPWGDEPYVVRLSGRPARYVRVTAERLWKRTDDYVFALAELQVQAGGKNVALGRPVCALDSIEAGRWSTRYLVDDFDSRQRLPDYSDPKIAKVLRRRADLLARLQRALRRQREQDEARLDPQTRAELERLRKELDGIKKPPAVRTPGDQVYAVVPRAPRPIYELNRGDVEQRGDLLGPGALTCVAGLDADLKQARSDDEGSRRAALADWIANPKNVLTWRSIVNRVWHYHFGRGLVDTPNDFGRNGSQPTHPELLDWLAVEFQDKGQSLKALHRLILLSAAYRQSSHGQPEFARADADNRWLWRMNRQRLEAEEIRDTVLAVSGRLDLKMGGPGFELFRFKDDHSPIYDHSALDKINAPAGWRRAVYRFTVRSVPNPFLECLDCADPNLNTPVRSTTLTALQALALLNDPFMIEQAKYFAERLRRISAAPRQQIEAAYLLAFGRPPNREESEELAGYARRYGLASACRLLFNTNEFVFID